MKQIQLPHFRVTHQTHMFTHSFIRSFIHIHSFHCHVQNATIPCRSEQLLAFFSVTYFFLPPLSTNYFSILPHFILPSISWSTSLSCCFQIHIQYSFGNYIFFLYTCPNQRNLCSLIVSVMVGYYAIA
jgi:hypothetical protein